MLLLFIFSGNNTILNKNPDNTWVKPYKLNKNSTEKGIFRKTKLAGVVDFAVPKIITWKSVRNVNYWALPLIYWISKSGNGAQRSMFSDAWQILRTTGLKHWSATNSVLCMKPSHNDKLLETWISVYINTYFTR